MAGIAFLAGPHAVMASDERAIDALLEGRFARDALGTRFVAALERTADPAYWLSFDTNPLRPNAQVRELQDRIHTIMPELLDRLDSRKDPAGRHFVIRGHSDRVGLTVESDETQKLHEEINHMRRQLDALRAGKRRF